MSSFLYEALDASGATVTDRIDAADEAAAEQLLTARGYQVKRLQPVSDADADLWSRLHPAQRPARPLPDRRRKITRGFGVIWSFFFLLMGAGFLYGLGIRPVLGVLRASHWKATPCVVISSELKEHRSTDSPGATYSIQIAYEYEFGGNRYRSNRYDFLALASNTNVAARRKVVADHPPGSRTICFVNPESPAEAILQRGWTVEMLWGLFPIPFVLIGLVGLLISTGLWRFQRRTDS